MEEKTDIQVLRELAQNNAVRTKIARIRDIYDEIEATQKAGVTNKAIVETLNKRGYDMGLKHFETMLHRIRGERAKAQQQERDCNGPIPDDPPPSLK